jgi:hypothetical protein
MAGVRHSGLSNVTASDTTVTDDLAVTDAFSASGVVQLGNSVSDGIALYGTTTISQRAGSAQSSSLIQSNSLGTAGAAIMTELWTTLTNLGVWKGAS